MCACSPSAACPEAPRYGALLFFHTVQRTSPPGTQGATCVGAVSTRFLMGKYRNYFRSHHTLEPVSRGPHCPCPNFSSPSSGSYVTHFTKYPLFGVGRRALGNPPHTTLCRHTDTHTAMLAGGANTRHIHVNPDSV